MKLIISSAVLITMSTLAQSSRLLQQTDACSTVRCGADGRTDCYVNPVNTDLAVCCAPDTLCDAADYQSTDVSICMDDGGRQKYDNKCLGRCDGNKACGQLCTCDTDADCATGYSCLETPFGFDTCDENTGNSCYGFCTIERRGACGGFVGPAGCNDDEACYLYSTEANSLGSCYSLPDTCVESTPSPTVCGSIENCAVFGDGCNTCDCGVDGSATSPRCTEIACTPDQTVPYFCDTCIEGYEPSSDGSFCVAVPTCRRDENCAGYSTGCSNCVCNANGTATCTPINTCNPNPITGEPDICNPCDPLIPIGGAYSCNACNDGYYLDDTGSCVETPSCGGIDFCSSYTSDSCGNTCSCGDSPFEFCTKIACGIDPPTFQPTCNTCVDGYKPSADGLSCEEDLGCFCPLNFDPVCCDGQTYGNQCQANCAGCGGITTEGVCPVECESKSDCDQGYKCRKDPICKLDPLIKCRDAKKVCVDYKLRNSCSTDKDCDVNNGEICLFSNNYGICVDYQSPFP